MRKIKIEFPKSQVTVYATVIEDKYPELADELWDRISEPLKCAVHHTVSTGDFIQCRPTPPYDVPKHTGDQSNPLGGDDVPYLCQMKNGEILWTGWYFAMAYGKCTEPLRGMGPIMAKVDEQYLEDFRRAGKDCWNYTYLIHELSTVIFSRGEEV